MDAFPRDLDAELRRARHHAAGARGDRVLRQLRPEMQAEDARNAVLFQNPGLADRLGAAGRLLGRLEDQQDVARQRLLRRDEIRQREQHGHMAVVAAGVHPPLVGRGKGQPAALTDGQRVHIAAEGDRFAFSEIKPRADRALPRRKHRARQHRKPPPQVGRRLRQGRIRFGDAVQRPAVGRQLLQQFLISHKKRSSLYPACSN